MKSILKVTNIAQSTFYEHYEGFSGSSYLLKIDLIGMEPSNVKLLFLHISWYAQHKDTTRMKIETQRDTCIMKANYLLKVQKYTLQISFVYWVKNYSSHLSDFVPVH